MEAMRESWTDERLDDGFDRVSADIALVRQDVSGLRRELHTEVGSLREDSKALRKEMHTEVGSLRKEMHTEIGLFRHEMHEEVGFLREDSKSLHDAMHSLQRTLLQTGAGIIAALIGVIITQL